MKSKFLLVAAVIVFAVVGAQAQDQGDIRATAGLAFGSKATADEDTGEDKGALGINFGGEYFVIDKVSIAPSYTYFFTGIDGYKFSAINIDARYFFLTDGTQVYALAGYTNLRAKADFGGASITVSNGGYNIGAGAIFPLSDQLGINVQAKYQAADGEGQVVANAGIVFKF